VPPARHWLPTALLCAYAFGFGFFALILWAQAQPDARGELALTLDAAARIHGATFAAAALGGYLAGRAADRGRRRLALGLATALPAVGLWWTSRATGVPELLCARLLTGLGVGGGWGVAHAALAAAVPAARRVLASGLVQCAAPVGTLAAAYVASRFDAAAGFGWREALARAALGGLAAPLVCAALPASADAVAAGAGSSGIRAALGPAGRRAAAVLLALLALQMGGYWLFYAWLPEWLGRDLGRPRDFVWRVQLALCAGFCAGDLLFAPVARRVGLVRAYVAASALFAAGVAATPAVVAGLADRPAPLSAALAATGLCAGLWAAFGPLYARHVAAAARGRVASTSYQLARAGQLALQPLVPALRAAGGFEAVFVVAAACAALGGAGALLLPPPPATSEGSDRLPAA
jgi:MFS family permease